MKAWEVAKERECAYRETSYKEKQEEQEKNMEEEKYSRRDLYVPDLMRVECKEVTKCTSLNAFRL